MQRKKPQPEKTRTTLVQRTKPQPERTRKTLVQRIKPQPVVTTHRDHTGTE